MKSTHAWGLLFSASSTGDALDPIHPILLEYFVYLFLFVRGPLDDLALFPKPFARIVLRVAAGRKKSAQPHRNRAGGDLCHPSQHDQVRRAHRSREACRQRKRHRQPVGHADNHVPDQRAGLKMAFNMPRVGTVQCHACREV